MSLDKDFSRAKYLFELSKSGKDYVAAISSDEVEAGTYYWRVADASGNMIIPEDGTRLDFGTLPVDAYSIKLDPSFYDDAELSNETELSLESVWLRSENNGNRIEWANAPYCGKLSIYMEPSTDYTNNHGMVVKGNTIYVARGTHNVSNWKYDRKQVWIDRYDLTTGVTLPMLRVRQDNGEDFTDGDLMTLLGNDSDGTVYFTSSIVASNGNKIRLYTVDLDNIVIQDGYEVALSHFENEFTVPASPVYVRFCEVRGSIKSKDYYLWGAPGWDNGNVRMESLEVPVYRWKCTGTSTSMKTAVIKHFSNTAADPKLYIELMSPKVIPVDDDRFYFQGLTSQADVYFYPTLYSLPLNNDTECQLITTLTEAPASVQTNMTNSPIGLSMFNIDGKSVLAYSKRSTMGTSVQLVELPENSRSFSNANPLWNINPSGFSDYQIQGCNVAFMPDEGSSAGGNLIVYVPNGGLGLYRLSVKGTTVGLDGTFGQDDISILGRIITFSHECHNVRVVDMSGRVNIHLDKTDSIDASSLSPGVYFVVSPSLTKSYKIILN
ncbi:MAG: T9SS type A sorting domain-containing protein [Muribaculum sp.]|nr:T9SS type A sorting domain-containing protein [Muribaculum sp.]